MDYFKACRALALHAVISDDPAPDYSLRRVFRWYSEKFHTPLHLVEELPVHDILQHYYEATFEDMAAEPAKLRDELIELSESDEEAEARQLKRERDAIEEFKFARDLAAEAKAQEAASKAKAAKTQNQPKKPRVWAGPDAAIRRTPIEPAPQRSAEFEAPESIKMSFVGLDEMDELVKSDGVEPLLGLKP